MIPVSSVPPIIDGYGNFIDPSQSQSPATGPNAVAPANGSVASAGGFSQALTDAVGSLSGLQNNANQAVAGLALNQGVDIHQAMLAMDQASLGMNLAVQVRDKAVEAYQSLLNMQM